MKTLRQCTGILALMVFCGGCKITTNITTFEELREYRRDPRNELRVMTTDKSIYELKFFTIRDSVLEGSGTVLTKDGYPTFTGELPLSSIIYLQGRKTSIGRTLFCLGVLGFVVSTGSAGEYSGLTIYEPLPVKGSCPYVYAWNGGSYVIQGELFGTALGRALETSTSCMLPATVCRNSTVRVRVTNERPETHYIDAIQLLAFEAPEGAIVVLDNTQRAWPVLHPQPPLLSPPQLLSADGIYLRSDLVNAGRGGSYRDTVELTFPRTTGSNEGSLIVRAVNTTLGNAVYDMVFGYLENDFLRFLDQIENDPQCIRSLREWIDEASLTVEVRREGRWVCAGRIAPEALATDINRIVRVTAGNAEEDAIHVRLSSLADLWKLDAVAFDGTPVQPLAPCPVAARSVVHTIDGDVAGVVSARDKNYAILLPGEQIEMVYDEYHPSPGRRAAYALNGTGYLYEWPPENGSSPWSPFQVVASATGQSDRLGVVNFLIRHKELVLALVYERWKDLRISDPG